MNNQSSVSLGKKTANPPSASTNSRPISRSQSVRVQSTKESKKNYQWINIQIFSFFLNT